MPIPIIGGWQCEDHDRELDRLGLRGERLPTRIFRANTKAPRRIQRMVVQGTGDAVRCLQLRANYMFVAEAKAGFTCL